MANCKNTYWNIWLFLRLTFCCMHLWQTGIGLKQEYNKLTSLNKNTYFDENASVKVLKVNCLVNFSSIENDDCSGHLEKGGNQEGVRYLWEDGNFALLTLNQIFFTSTIWFVGYDDMKVIWGYICCATSTSRILNWGILPVQFLETCTREI